MCLEVRDDVVGNRESAPSVVNVERLWAEPWPQAQPGLEARPAICMDFGSGPYVVVSESTVDRSWHIRDRPDAATSSYHGFDCTDDRCLIDAAAAFAARGSHVGVINLKSRRRVRWTHPDSAIAARMRRNRKVALLRQIWSSLLGADAETPRLSATTRCIVRNHFLSGTCVLCVGVPDVSDSWWRHLLHCVERRA